MTGKEGARRAIKVLCGIAGVLILLSLGFQAQAWAFALLAVAALIGLVYVAVLVTEWVKKGQPVARFWAAVDRKMGR